MQTSKHQGQQRKPPLPSPFMQKMEGSYSKLALYSNNQPAQKGDLPPYQQYQKASNMNKQLQNMPQYTNPPEGKLHYNLKSNHQISQGHIPTIGQLGQQEEEQMRQTWGKMKPKIISKQLPLPFSNINSKPKR